jgi:two-component system, chemotaxis family, CheB/CheR fusion protein
LWLGVVSMRQGNRTTSQRRRGKPSVERVRSAKAVAPGQCRPHNNAASKAAHDLGNEIASSEGAPRARPYAEAIINSIHKPLLVIDENMRVQSASRWFYRFFNCTPAGTLRRLLPDTDAHHLNTPQLRALLERIKNDPLHGSEIEMTVDPERRDKRTLIVAAEEIRGPGVPDKRILISFDDVTDFKHTERQLAVAKQAAERATLAKSRFLAAASHDLRQPLQTLTLLHGALRQRAIGGEVLALLERADRALDSMSGMLTTLLDINQLDAGIIRLQLTSFPISEKLNLLESEFAELARGKGLRWRVIPSSVIVRSDRRLLREMLRNLLTNAIRYTDKGSILLGCRRRGDRLSIEVWDSGIGISEDAIPRIFQEYQQAADTPQRGGLGLGLAIVQHLGELLDHPVRSRSQIGKGSVFAIEVPTARSRSKPEHKAADPQTEEAPRQGTVLIIEDDVLVREPLELMLRNEGHHVVATAGGDTALALITGGGLRPDLIISDYTLSGTTTGTDVAAVLRSALRWQVPVIILTGDIRVATFSDIAASNCVGLRKPVRTADLLNATQRWLPPASSKRETSNAQPPATQPSVVDQDATIFVVDDNRYVREAMRVLLMHVGYRVKTFANAQAFLDSYRPGDKGCLITDVRMPGMGGFELLAQFAAAGHGLPAIVITGQGDITTAVQAMKAGAVDFIEKPTNPETLLACINRALQQVASPDQRSARRSAAAMRIAGLTPREREVMELVVAGHANKEIAYRLGISQRTIETHRAAVMKKIGVSSLSDLIRLEIEAR